MPIYEYKCEVCGEELEVIQKPSEPPKKKCPKCGGKLKKKLSAPAIQFKGTGWYVTDYARSGGAKSDESRVKAKPTKAHAVKKDAGASKPGKD